MADPDIVLQASSIAAPRVGGAASASQGGALAATGGLTPRVVVQAASIAPGRRTGSARGTQRATTLAPLHQVPRLVAAARDLGALAAQATQTRPLVAWGTTGPIPRPRQRATLLARGHLLTVGGFGFPVPQTSLVAAGLLALQGAAGLAQQTWLVAGVVPVDDGAPVAATQRQGADGTGQIVFPRLGAARATARATLVPTPRVRHPLVLLVAPLWAARAVGRTALAGAAALVPIARRWPFRTARGLGRGGRYTFASARSLRAGLYAFRSARGLGGANGGVYRFRANGGGQGHGGGPDVVAIPVPPTPRRPSLRTNDLLGVALDFAPDLAPGDSIATATVTVLAQLHERAGAPPDDVTPALLRTSAVQGSTVTALLDGSGATVGTAYAVRVAVTLAGGGRIQETITPLICDE